MYDYQFELDYRTRAAELQDIAALDRLAAQAAPASALRRYGENRGGQRSGLGADLVERLRHVLHIGSTPTAASHR